MFERAELLCRHSGVALITVRPLPLTGAALCVWSELPPGSRSDCEKARSALHAAVALDEQAAYEAFTKRTLRAGESADVFPAELPRLAALFGGVPDRAAVCAFVAGLPDSAAADPCRLPGGESPPDVPARARAVLGDSGWRA